MTTPSPHPLAIYTAITDNESEGERRDEKRLGRVSSGREVERGQVLGRREGRDTGLDEGEM